MSYTNNVEGWISPVELWWLHEKAKRFSTVLEIGAYKGKSATAFCDAIPNGMVFSVDIFNDADAAIFKANLGPRTNHTLLRMTSLEAAKRFAGTMFDMVFIDGDHSYESARDDIAAWTPRCRHLLCGHDFTDDGQGHWPGVIKAVDEAFVNTGGLIMIVDTLWIKWITHELL